MSETRFHTRKNYFTHRKYKKNFQLFILKFYDDEREAKDDHYSISNKIRSVSLSGHWKGIICGLLSAHCEQRASVLIQYNYTAVDSVSNPQINTDETSLTQNKAYVRSGGYFSR
jgi:hypothetical protein